MLPWILDGDIHPRLCGFAISARYPGTFISSLKPRTQGPSTLAPSSDSHIELTVRLITRLRCTPILRTHATSTWGNRSNITYYRLQSSPSTTLLPEMEFRYSHKATARQRGNACTYCHSRKMRCDRRKPCSTCLKYKIKLCTYPAFRPRKYHLNLGSGFGVWDPGYVKGEDTEFLNWEAPEKTQPTALSSSDHPLTIATLGKRDETSSDLEVKQPMTISAHELQVRVQSVDSQKVDHFISPSLDTRPSGNELSCERNAVMMDQSPTTWPGVSPWASFPGAANTLPVMEAPFLSDSATISSVPGELASGSLPHSQTSFDEGMDAQDTQDAQFQEPYVLQNGILRHIQSAWSTSIPTNGRSCSSPDTVHSTTIPNSQNENTTDDSLKLTLGAKPWRMNNMSHATLFVGNSYWRCGCPREDHITFVCDHTCRLNQECSLHLARDLSFMPESVVAILSVLTQQHTSTYTFYWSHQRGICATFKSSDTTSRNPFWTGQCYFSLVWVYEQLVRLPDNFTRSNLERAGLMVAVITLREFDEIHSNVFREGILTLPSLPEDRNPIQKQGWICHGPRVAHNSALDTRKPMAARTETTSRKRRGKKRSLGLRTRTGCLTCRESHVKCDEVKEICGRCTKRNLICIYEEQGRGR